MRYNRLGNTDLQVSRICAANIIGATRIAQLQSNIASIDLELSSEVMEAIEAIHQGQPNPCP